MAKRRARFGRPRSSGGRKKTNLPGAQPPAPPPPAYAPQAPPIDPILTEQTGLNARDLDTTLAGIEYGRTQIAQSYGFNALGQLDPSNPYNRATMLQRSYQQGQRGTENSMAGRGQLYSGALQRGLDEGTFQYGRNYDSLRRQASDAYSSLSQQEQQARSGRAQSDLDAYSDSLGRAQDTRPTDPGAPTPEMIAQFIAAAQKPKPKKPKPNQQNWQYRRTNPRGQARLG